jgi:hypothetical protein
MSLTGVGVEHTIDDKEYTFSPLTFADLEWFELRMRAKAIEAGRMAAESLPTKEARDAEMERVYANANKISILSSFEQLFSPSGVAVLLQRMVSRHHPEVTADDTMRWTQEPSVLNGLMPKLALLMPGVAKKNNVAHPVRAKRK